MKKIIALILAMTLCISLCACSKSKEATECENLINAIGEVNSDSAEAIAAAEKAYAALSDKDKDSVSESAVILKEARAAYTFELSKAAYQNINLAYGIVSEFGSDLYNAWYLVGYESKKLMNTNTVKAIASQVQYLEEEEIQMGLAYTLAKNKYKEDWYALSETDKDRYIEMAGKYEGDDFFDQTNCLFITTWSVIRAYELNGEDEKAEEYLKTAQLYMRELSEKYSDYEHYPNLKSFFAMVRAYLDVCRDSGMSFTQYKDVKKQYETEAREFINGLDFIFAE